VAKSAVAGILSPDGGLRTIVTQRWRMQGHLAKGERLFVVPGLLVEEPVPWEEIPTVIRQVHQHIVKTLAPENPCGECRACCITLYIAQGDGWTRPPKPSHTACEWCDKETGCLVHFNRPGACRKFRCLWLASQDRNWRMDEDLRPDRCGVIMTGPEPGDPEDLFYVHPSAHDPDAINREPVVGYLKKVQSQGQRAKLVTHYRGEKP
jgi:hypothetical protein